MFSLFEIGIYCKFEFLAMSRKFRVEVGVQALDSMTEILQGEDRNDEEIVGYALDTLANICSPDEFEEEIQVILTCDV